MNQSRAYFIIFSFCLIIATPKSSYSNAAFNQNIYQLQQIDNSHLLQMANQDITSDLFLNSFQMAKKESDFDFEEMLEKIMDKLQDWMDKVKKTIKDFQK